MGNKAVVGFVDSKVVDEGLTGLKVLSVKIVLCFF